MTAPRPRTTQVDPAASIGPGVELSHPHCVGAHAVLAGPLSAGPGLRVEAGALIGGPAQHRGGDAGSLQIGADVHLHEACTVHRGSSVGSGLTRLGDRVRVMAYAHVGHDVCLDDDVTLANGAQLGGHGSVGVGATIGARAALHQFVQVGQGAMVAAGAYVSGDVLPWCLVGGDRARVRGDHRVALRRAGLGHCTGQVGRALRLLSPGRGGGLSADDARVQLEARGPVSEAAEHLLAFAARPRERPLCPWGVA